MKATDLDYDTDCPICNRTNDKNPNLDLYPECPACNDSGKVNRYQDADDGKVVIGYHEAEISQRGETETLAAIHEMPERDEETGGFEGRFGDWTPHDVDSDPMTEYEQDTRERLQNQQWVGEYRVGGNAVNAKNIGEGVDGPSNPDFSLSEVVQWKKERGDPHRASELEEIEAEMQREGVTPP